LTAAAAAAAPAAAQVNFWDVRVNRLMKKGRKAEDSLELVWKPTHSVHIISLIGGSSPDLCTPRAHAPLPFVLRPPDKHASSLIGLPCAPLNSGHASPPAP